LQGRGCRALPRFRSTCGSEFLSTPRSFALRFSQLGRAALPDFALAGQLILENPQTSVQRLEIGAGLAKLPTQGIGTGHARRAFALRKTQCSLLSAQLLALLDDPALDLQHDIRVGKRWHGVIAVLVVHCHCRRNVTGAAGPAGGWL